MANEKELKLAGEAFRTLCESMDELNWRYEKDEEKMVIHFRVTGEDIPMEFVVHCDAERQLIRLMSFLSFKIMEDKRIDLAIATSHANYLLADGSFDYNLGDGTIIFRMTSSFRESLVGVELFKYMIQVACLTVDKYNDKFLMLSKGMLSIADFIKGEN